MKGRGLVLAYHIIFTAYGFWLPNDPRGSWSDFVWAWELRRFGEATKVTTRRNLAYDPHDRALRLEAKTALLRPPVHFNGEQARAIAQGFDDACQSGGYRIPECSILPDHVHAVVRRHSTRSIETIANHLKARASIFLVEADLHPFQYETDSRGERPTAWTESFWQVYLDSPEDIERARKYVRKNPIKEGLREQNWWFLEQNQSAYEERPGPKAGAKR